MRPRKAGNDLGLHYSNPIYLRNWRERGHFPGIHRDLVNLVKAELRGRSVVDLCGDTGLLGLRLKQELGVKVSVVEGNLRAVERAKQAQVPLHFYSLTIKPESYPTLGAILESVEADTIVARRCFSELFSGPDDPNGPVFAKLLREVDIMQVFLQGRAPSTAKAVCRMPSVHEEIAILRGYYRVVQQHGQLAHLVAC